MQELNYRPKGIALLEFPLRAGSPAGRTITNVRVGKISVYPGRAEALPGAVFAGELPDSVGTHRRFSVRGASQRLSPSIAGVFI